MSISFDPIQSPTPDIPLNELQPKAFHDDAEETPNDPVTTDSEEPLEELVEEPEDPEKDEED